MNQRIGRWVAWGVLALATTAWGADEPKPAADVPDRFEQLKSLAGEWVGQASHGGKPVDTKVIYRVTAGGNTVEETQFAGTNHEMVTMYHRDGKSIVLTHYCAAGNQPRMKWDGGADPKKMQFRFLDGTNLKAEEDFHMHDATIEFVDKDHLKSEWVSFQRGKAVGAAKFDLQRKK